MGPYEGVSAPTKGLISGFVERTRSLAIFPPLIISSKASVWVSASGHSTAISGRHGTTAMGSSCAVA